MINRDFLKNLPNLTKQESTAIKNFENDETRAGFVGISDILRTRGYLEESIIMLEDGLRRFPKYSSARAQLASDYLARGMPIESLRETKRVNVDAPDNAQAQRLALKLQIFFDKQNEARSTLSILKKLVPDDVFTSTVRKCIANDDWTGAKKWVLSHFERFGISIAEQHNEVTGATFLDTNHDTAAGKGSWQVPAQLPPKHPNTAANSVQAPNLIVQAPNQTRSPDQSVHSKNTNTQHAVNLPKAFTLGSSLAHIRGDADRYLALRSVRPQVLRGFFFSQHQEPNSEHGLDDTTIAELYRSQGLNSRAAAVFNDSTTLGIDNFDADEQKERPRRNSDGKFFSDNFNNEQPAKKELDTARSAKVKKLKALLGNIDGF
jgi:tetratricopeptide (TPR) repeat protein